MYGKPKILIVLLRITLGWIFFYSGLSKILDNTWSAKGFLLHAGSFPAFYQWFASPQNIFWVDVANKWGQLLVGLALILGVFVNLASLLAIALMVLYYFPGLHFPRAGQNGFLIDEHIIYAIALLLLIRLRASNYFGLGSFFGG